MTDREQFESVRKAWARFKNELHRSPDAPYPGMSEAFEQHFSQSFADREWRAESATWAAAWKAAKRHEAQEQPAPSEDSITAGILSGMFLSLDGHDKAQPGYEWRKGWNDAIRQAMDYAQPAPSVPDDMIEQAVTRFLSWKLPKDFRPDGGMVFIPTKGRGYDSPYWPCGTNLLNAQQARDMLRHVLAADPEAKT